MPLKAPVVIQYTTLVARMGFRGDLVVVTSGIVDFCKDLEPDIRSLYYG